MKIKFMKSLMTVFLAVVSFMGMAQNQPDGKQMMKRLETVLCPDQKPVGKSAAANTPDIRVVTVKDFSDAHAYLIRICPQKDIRKEKKGGNVYYTYTLPDGMGQLVLTDKVKAGTEEVAVMDVEVEGLKGKVSQIRFTK